MKKNLFVALAILSFLIGCNTSGDEIIDTDDDLKPVRFSLALNEEILPFPTTRAMPPVDMPDPIAVTKGDEEKGIGDLCKTIEYIVFKESSNTAFRHQSFTLDNFDMDEFGIISDHLPAGKYKIFFLGHNCSPATLSGKIISFDKVCDTFYYPLEMTVNTEGGHEENIMLYRIVSKIEFVAKDRVPAHAEIFTMEVGGYPHGLDLFTGKGVGTNEETVSFSYTFTDEDYNKTDMTHSFFTFVPEQSDLDVTLKTIDIEDNMLRERAIADITPIANRIIRYTGLLYTIPSPSDDKFILHIEENGKWEEAVENDLQD